MVTGMTGVSPAVPRARGRGTMKALLGDYAGFFGTQRKRLEALGIDISGCAVSHIAYRTRTYDEYVELRDAIEQHSSANVENVWNGRPISKLLLAEPIRLAAGVECELIELIPPVHRERFAMGLEHVGLVLGDRVDQFAVRHREVLSGQQHQSEVCEPYFIKFDDDTTVKFYRYSLKDVCEREGQRFDGIYHV